MFYRHPTGIVQTPAFEHGYTTRRSIQDEYVPSKTTPNDPSPIFFPTRKLLPTMPFEVAEVAWWPPEEEAITCGVVIAISTSCYTDTSPS